MQRVTRTASAQRLSRSSEAGKSTGFVEIAFFSLLGLAVTLLLIAHDLFPVLPVTFAQ
jgi:hypothetical protein